jgi:hypothetical protein
MEDHFRRKAFFMLYEFDYKVSAALGRPAFMRESDFDVRKSPSFLRSRISAPLFPMILSLNSNNHLYITHA